MDYAISSINSSSVYRERYKKEMNSFQSRDRISWLTVMEVSIETGTPFSSKFGTQGDYVESVTVE